MPKITEKCCKWNSRLVGRIVIFLPEHDLCSSERLSCHKKTAQKQEVEQLVPSGSKFWVFHPVKSQRNGFAGVEKGYCLPTIFLPSGDFPSNHCGRQSKLVKNHFNATNTNSKFSVVISSLQPRYLCLLGKPTPFFSARFWLSPSCGCKFQNTWWLMVAHRASWMLVSRLKQSC